MIESHQDLLEKYYASERTVMGEYSVSIVEDELRLIRVVRRYAEEMCLDSSFTNEDYDDLRSYGSYAP